MKDATFNMDLISGFITWGLVCAGVVIFLFICTAVAFRLFGGSYYGLTPALVALLVTSIVLGSVAVVLLQIQSSKSAKILDQNEVATKIQPDPGWLLRPLPSLSPASRMGDFYPCNAALPCSNFSRFTSLRRIIPSRGHL